MNKYKFKSETITCWYCDKVQKINKVLSEIKCCEIKSNISSYKVFFLTMQKCIQN
jgi:hypothetical protein